MWLRDAIARLNTAVREATGPQLLSLPIFVTGLAASTILRILGTPFGSRATLLEQLTDGLTAYLAFWLWTWLIIARLHRHKPSWHYVILAIFLVGSALRGALVHFLITDHEPEPIELLGYRMLSGIMLVGLLMVAASYTLFHLRFEAGRVEELTAYRQALARALTQTSGELESWYSQLVLATKRRLNESLRPKSKASYRIVSKRLKETISSVVRPLSRELSEGIRPSPKFREPVLSTNYNWRQLLAAAESLSWRTRPLLTPLLISLISIPSVYVFGIASAFVAFLGFSGLFALGLFLVNSMLWFESSGWNLWSRSAYFFGLLFLASLPAAYYTVWMIGFLETRPAELHRAAMLLTFGFSFVAVLVSAIDATRRALLKVEEELERTIEVLRWHLAKTKGEMWQRQLSLARTLHGPIQALLTAHSIRIDLAEPTEKSALSEEALQECRVAIDGLAELGALSTEIERDFTTIRDRWTGICAVTTEISARATAAMQADRITSRIVVDLIQDALSNAVRHGAADSVGLAIDVMEEGLISVAVTDNGIGFSQPIKPGVGTGQLEALSLNWSLLRVDANTVLRFSVPFGEGTKVESIREFTEPVLLD